MFDANLVAVPARRQNHYGSIHSLRAEVEVNWRIRKRLPAVRKPLGTHRFQRAVSTRRLIASQLASCRDRTLEAMRTQARFPIYAPRNSFFDLVNSLNSLRLFSWFTRYERQRAISPAKACKCEALVGESGRDDRLIEEFRTHVGGQAFAFR